MMKEIGGHTRETWSFNKWGINDPDNHNGNEYQLLTIREALKATGTMRDIQVIFQVISSRILYEPLSPDSDGDGLSIV